MKKSILIFIMCLLQTAVNAQIYVEGMASTGILLEQNDNMAALEKERPYAFELSVSRKADSDWAAFYNYPRYGLKALFVSPGNPDDIGQIYALLPYMRFSFLNEEYLFNPGLRLGAGIGYVTKPYDPNDNYKNLALSSHLNAALTLDIDVEARLFERLYLRSSIGVVHLSNGASKIPNYGINLLAASIGACYVFGETAESCFAPTGFKKKERSFIEPGEGKEKDNRKYHLDIFLAGGLKESRILYDGEKYGLAAVSVQGSYRYARQLAVGVAVDLYYNEAEQKEVIKEEAVEIDQWQVLKPGVALNHEFFFGRLSVFAQGGVYIPLHKYNHNQIYQRFALRYAATDRFKLHLGIKTHYYFGLAADCIELGAGFRIL